MKRLFDLLFGMLSLIIMIIPLILLSIGIKLTSEGPVLFWSKRVGRNNIIFEMPKFRTMKINTPMIATHLIEEPELFLTSFGKFLRKTSLDELPQIYSILKGDLSFVGPRPALYNQYDLIKLRKNNSIDKLIPGLTGWAQINGRDDISISEKVDFDLEYLERRSFLFDLEIIWHTFIKVLKREGVSH